MKPIAIHEELTKMTAHQLIQSFDQAVLNEKRCTHVVLNYINEVDSRRLHVDLGYESIYKLLTGRHKYSSNQAYDRIDAARVIKIKPDVADKVHSGELNLTQLIKVGQCLKQEQKFGRTVDPEVTANILEQIENKTVFETEKVLAVELNFTPKQYQKLSPQKDESVRVSMTLTAEQFEVIAKVQSLISHSVPSNDLAEVFTYLAKKHIKKVEGKSASEVAPAANKNSSVSQKTAPDQIESTRSFPNSRLRSGKKSRRRYISLKTRRRLLAGANYECTFVDDDKNKCRSKFCLQVDHITPLAMGGDDKIENLRILCGYHNRSEARRWNLMSRSPRSSVEGFS